MNLKRIECGCLDTNSYILYNHLNEAIIIDAPDGIYRVEHFIKEQNLKPIAVLLTHGHFDHIAGTKALQDLGAKVYLHKDDILKIEEDDIMATMCNVKIEPFDVDVKITEDGEIEIKDFLFEVIQLPGHTKGGVGYKIDNLIFVGDTMFKDSFGRYDFHDSNKEQLKESLIKLYNQKESTIVLPGHGEESTIKREKINNLVRYI